MGAGLGVQLGQVGCFGAPDSVFGPVRLGSFLSHQMNTVHCKIKFSKKKYLLNLIKNQIKSNKFDKIFEK